MSDQQQKDIQSPKPQMPPNLSGGSDKEAAGKPGFKTSGGVDSKKVGAKDEEEDSKSSCGTGSCG